MTLACRAFCLIRHGETVANRDGWIAGRLEVALTPAGRAAARALSAWDWPGPIAVLSSPQRRARETAALAFPGRPVAVLDGLRERDWGRFEGRPLAELPARIATPEGGEPWDAIVARVAQALAQCQTAAGAALPVIVAHSGVIRAARALTGQGFDGPSAPNTTPLMFDCAAGRWQMRALTPDGGLS